MTKGILLKSGKRRSMVASRVCWVGNFKVGRSNNSIFVIWMDMINKELKTDDIGKEERIPVVIPLNGQDEGAIFRQKQSNSRGKADVWVWMLGGG